MFALRLVSGFRRLGFLVVIHILSGKVRCAYRYENGCMDTTHPAAIGQLFVRRVNRLRCTWQLLPTPYT